MWMKVITLGAMSLGTIVLASTCGVPGDGEDEEDLGIDAAEIERLPPCNPIEGPWCPPGERCSTDDWSRCDPREGIGCDGVCVDDDLARRCPSGPPWKYVFRDPEQCAAAYLDCGEHGAFFSNECGCGCRSYGKVCGRSVCAPGMVCCNSSCGICTPPGGACIQMFCGFDVPL